MYSHRFFHILQKSIAANIFTHESFTVRTSLQTLNSVHYAVAHPSISLFALAWYKIEKSFWSYVTQRTYWVVLFTFFQPYCDGSRWERFAHSWNCQHTLRACISAAPWVGGNLSGWSFPLPQIILNYCRRKSLRLSSFFIPFVWINLKTPTPAGFISSVTECEFLKTCSILVGSLPATIFKNLTFPTPKIADMLLQPLKMYATDDLKMILFVCCYSIVLRWFDISII